MNKVKITRHEVFKDATIQADWLNDKFSFWSGLICHRPQSYLTHIPVYGGDTDKNAGNMANIWYIHRSIDLYDKKHLDLFKEFAKKFGYKNIELYEE